MVVAAHIVRADAPTAFLLEGTFENIHNERHLDGGGFSINVSGNRALVELVHENEYREVAGTDGIDSYVLTLFTGPSWSDDYQASATIRSGRYPVDAEFYTKILWLLCTQDKELLAEAEEDNLFFYEPFTPEEVTWLLDVMDDEPKLVESISWYGPNTIALGTNRYPINGYPNGWLMANARVTETMSVQGLALPSRIEFTQTIMHAFTNASQLPEPQPRDPEDVRTIGGLVFVVTNAQISSPRSTYLPECSGVIVRVDDKRPGGGVVLVPAGDWWNTQNRMQGWLHPRQLRRGIFAVLLLSMSLIIVVIMAVLRRRTK